MRSSKSSFSFSRFLITCYASVKHPRGPVLHNLKVKFSCYNEARKKNANKISIPIFFTNYPRFVSIFFSLYIDTRFFTIAFPKFSKRNNSKLTFSNKNLMDNDSFHSSYQMSTRLFPVTNNVNQLLNILKKSMTRKISRGRGMHI